LHPERLERLRVNSKSKVFKEALEEIRNKAEMAMNIPYSIGSQERALWGHYYNCDIHGVKLSFNWNSPHEHRCPICDKKFSGSPYDGAWVGAAHYRIGNGLEHLGLYSLITGEQQYAEKALSFLRQYAQYYKAYSIHGGIPYNGPGKLFQQTLDESHWLINVCMAYAAIDTYISPEDRHLIGRGLILPCANFLIQHKENQIHNHSLLITSAISMSGFLLKDQEIQRAGLQGEFGLLDQIRRGVLEDGFWYEGSFSYHYYALNPIIYYCLLTEGTQWDLRMLPELKAMFDLPLGFVLPNGKLPSWNDTPPGKSLAGLAPYYEVALDWYGDSLYREVLHTVYLSASDDLSKRTGRSSMFALLFGDPEYHEGRVINNVKLDAIMRSSYATTGSGLAKLVNKHGWYLVAKHSPFGGEHDHMDRLSISFGLADRPLFTDMGTVQYAVPAHYAWYKHTYSHNTVGIDGCDQPPQDACLSGYGEADWGSWCSGYVQFGNPTWKMKERITLPAELAPWDEEAYLGVTINRLNMLTDDYLIDIVQVKAPIGKRVDVLFHMSARLKQELDWLLGGQEEPLCQLTPELFEEICTYPMLEPNAVNRLEWELGDESSWMHGEQFPGGKRPAALDQQLWCSHKVGLWTALTPSNPATASNQSLAERVLSDGQDIRFINVYQPRIAKDPSDVWSLLVEQSTEDGLQLLMSKGKQRVRKSVRLHTSPPAFKVVDVTQL
jgi:hypothetical protein